MAVSIRLVLSKYFLDYKSAGNVYAYQSDPILILEKRGVYMSEQA